MYLLNQPLPNGISTPEQINIIIQALDDFILYSRIDLNEFFNRFSITEIVKAYLCNPIVCSTRVQSYIAQRYTIDLAFISQIQSLEINMILKNFIQMERSPLQKNSLIVFLSLSYPQSYDGIISFYHNTKSQLIPDQQNRVLTIAEDLQRKFSLKIESEPESPTKDTIVING